MGDIANYARAEKFIEEFESDILRVYEIKNAPWIVSQYLELDVHNCVRFMITMKTDDAAFVSATVHAPVFYNPEISGAENLELLIEALEPGDEWSSLKERMKKIGVL